MKKFVSIALTLALCGSLAAPALAAESQGLTRGETAQLLAKVCGYTDELAAYAAKDSAFTDVDNGADCKAAAALLADKGLMRGDGTGAFHPERVMTADEVSAVLLRWVGLTDEVIGTWPNGNASLAASLELTAEGPVTEASLTALAEKAAEYRAVVTAETPAPLFVNGMAQPIFPYSTVMREVVYVETDVDSDGDGKADLLQVLIQRPAATAQGMKVPAIFEARPYSAGCTDAYDLDTWNAHVVNAQLTEAKTSTKATKDDWTWTPADKTVETRTPAGTGSAGDGGDVWTYTENLDSYDYWLVRGYAYVSCSGLGTLGSDGFETCASADETAAFGAVVRWLSGDESVKAYSDRTSNLTVAADWCNGSVGMSGQSYGGSTAFAVATLGIEGLKTIVPRAGISSWYDYYRSQGTAAGGLFYPGDDCDILADYCMSRQFDEADYATVKDSYEAYLAQMIEDQDRLGGDYNLFWDERNYASRADGIECSALIIHGLNDFNVRPKQFDMMYDAFRTAGQDVGLILHQGAHMTPTELEVLDLNGILGRWYAHYLYGVDNGAEKEPGVRVQSNLDLTWNTYETWDGERKTVSFTAGEGQSTFTSDLSVTSFDTTQADVDDGWIEYCTDMVYAWEKEIVSGETDASTTYAFDVTEDLHISGTPTVTVRASADRPTGILSAMLVDVAPEGMDAAMLEPYTEGVPRETLVEGGLWQGGGLENQDLTQFVQTRTDSKIITRGWMDIQNRTSAYQVDVVKPGTAYDFTLELQPMDYVVKAGHQLVLVLYSVDAEVTYWPEAVTNFTVDNAKTTVNIPVLP